MSEKSKDRSSFGSEIEAKASRKIRARQSKQGVWFGLGMMGLVGWSVVVPTLLGAALGLWLDQRHVDLPAQGKFKWTLALLLAGLVLGCWNAWQWVAKEDQAMREGGEDTK